MPHRQKVHHANQKRKTPKKGRWGGERARAFKGKKKSKLSLEKTRKTTKKRKKKGRGERFKKGRKWHSKHPAEKTGDGKILRGARGRRKGGKDPLRKK